MSRSNRLGMKTFDQSLFELYEAGLISYEDALRNADSKNELRLKVKLESKREIKHPDEGGAALQIVEEEEGAGFLAHARGLTRSGAGDEHQAALQADGRAQGVGSFFHLQRARQDQDRGKDLSVNKQVLSPETVRQAALGLMSAEQLEYFNEELEIDFAISEPGLGRFRVNVFYQRGYPAMVLRYITAEMPKLEDLGMPDIFKDLVMLKRGLILMVGAAGAGKSTTLAAMIKLSE